MPNVKFGRTDLTEEKDSEMDKAIQDHFVGECGLDNNLLIVECDIMAVFNCISYCNMDDTGLIAYLSFPLHQSEGN